ncbi:MAG: T9SS type A sorting domain-containing protein [Saprospiraceae bacterium]|nr:T9SS type A sorting domain-containing protein [Saprospiraceae bacterium]
MNGKNHYRYDDIKYILDKNQCNNCHNSSGNNKLWHYETYNAILTGSTCNIPIIKHGSASSSLLVDKLNGGSVSCGNAMPLGGKSISFEDLLAIESWINSGAPEFCLFVFEDVKTMLYQEDCGTCHKSVEDWHFENYIDIFTNGRISECSTSPLITLHDANNSILYRKLLAGYTGCGKMMPLEREPLSYINVSKIRDWINAGAPENIKALPVALSELNVFNEKDERVTIIWKTASELNTEKYEVQHSADGIHFTSFETIAAKGNELSGAMYVAYHENIKVGFNYYRLKIMDFTHEYTYSPIRVIQVRNVFEIYSVFPNPTQSGSVLQLEWYPLNQREKVKFLLMDFSGRLVFEKIIQNGINYVQLPELNPGVFYMTIRDYDDQLKVQKLIVLGN